MTIFDYTNFAKASAFHFFLIYQEAWCAVVGYAGYFLYEKKRQKRLLLFNLIMSPVIVIMVFSIFGIMSTIGKSDNSFLDFIAGVLRDVGTSQGLRDVAAIFLCVMGVERIGVILRSLLTTSIKKGREKGRRK